MKLENWGSYKSTEEDKVMGFLIDNSLVIRNINQPFIDRIITCDKK